MKSGMLCLGLAALAGCVSRPQSDLTSVAVAGAPGTSFSGYYVQNARRVDFTGQTPLTVSLDGLSELVIRKEDPEQLLVLGAQNDVDGWRSETMSSAGVGLSGLRLRVHRGLTVEKLTLGE